MKLKKLIALLMITLLAITTVLGFTACDPGETPPTQYTVTFDYNYDNAPADSTKSVESGKTVSKPTDPTRAGYNFTGWYTNATCTTEYNFTSAITSDTTLYAGWEEIIVEYTVTFDYNYNNAPADSTKSVESGNTVSKPTDPTRAGYNFTGWYTNATCTTEYNFTSAITSDTTLYAGWEEIIVEYTVTFDYNYDGKADDTEKVVSGNTVSKPTDPTRAEYLFVGWFTDESLSTSYNFESSVNGDITLYAKWIQTNVECTVTFDYNYDGQPDSTDNVLSGDTVSKPTDPTRSGFNFTGWYTDSGCTSEYNFNTIVSGDITLYAGWYEIPVQYTVTYNYNYTGSTNSTAKALSTEPLAEPTAPDRDGYAFTGWYTEASCTNQYDFSSKVTGDFTLYAGWTEQTGYVATFYLNYGENEVFYTCNFEKRISETPATDPTRDGYVFSGWYMEPECTTAYSNRASYSSDTPLYAYWRKIHTLEAEYTELVYADGTEKKGNGFSGSTSGTGMIQSDSEIKSDNPADKASNGFYVGWLFYKYAFIDFAFVSDREISDATIVLRLSAEYDDINVTGDQLQVEVNLDTETERIYNFPLTIDAYDFEEMNTYGMQVFSNYLVANNVTIREGENLITFVVNNTIEGSGATMDAAAPVIDCLYLYTNAEISTTLHNVDYVESKK